MAGLMAQRRLTPELLDHLPPTDAQAIGSRRDLVWINAIMFQAAIMSRRLRKDLPGPPRRILEIGCGDGAFMLAVARRMARHWPDVQVVLLDQQDLVPSERRRRFVELGWRIDTVTSDALAWMEQAPAGEFDLVTANLFLHHFDEAQLTRLLAAARRLAPAFVATEPRRGAVALAATGLLRVIGANAVTLHDAAVSVQAGFAGQELSRLWPDADRMKIRERAEGPFTHLFSAVEAAP